MHMKNIHYNYKQKLCPCYVSSVFYSGVREDSGSLECDAISLHQWFLTLRRK